MDELVYLGNFIKLHRELLNLNLSQLAYKCNYSRSYIGLIESGKIQKSEKFESAVTVIFSQLKLDYNKYKQEELIYKNKIDKLIKYIIYGIEDKQKEIIDSLINEENKIASHRISPRYYLAKFVYYMTIGNTQKDLHSKLSDKLLRNIDIYTTFDRTLLLTYIGVYYRINVNLSESEKFLSEALEVGEITGISGITYYQLAITQSLLNKLVQAYANVQKASRFFITEKNLKRLFYSQAQEAVILGRCNQLVESQKIFEELLLNYQLPSSLINPIRINLAQIMMKKEDFSAVVEILDSIKMQSDNIAFMKLYSLLQLGKYEEFINFYNQAYDKVYDIVLKQQIKVLWYKNNENDTSEEFINLLLDNYQKIKGRYDVDIEMFTLNQIISYYEEKGRYKAANSFLNKKIELLIS